MERDALTGGHSRKKTLVDKIGSALESAIIKSMLMLAGFAGFMRFDSMVDSLNDYRDLGGENGGTVLAIAFGLMFIVIGMVWIMQSGISCFARAAERVSNKHPILKVPMKLSTFIPYVLILYWCYWQGYIGGINWLNLVVAIAVGMMLGVFLKYSPWGKKLKERLQTLDKKEKRDELHILAESEETEEESWWEEKEKRWAEGVLLPG